MYNTIFDFVNDNKNEGVTKTKDIFVAVSKNRFETSFVKIFQKYIFFVIQSNLSTLNSLTFFVTNRSKV